MFGPAIVISSCDGHVCLRKTGLSVQFHSLFAWVYDLDMQMLRDGCS